MNFVFVGSSPRAFGSEQHFVSLAIACHEAGHRVVAVVRARSPVATLLRAAGIDVRESPFRGGADPRALLATFKAIREIKAQWIVTPHQKHFWPLYVLTRLTRTRLAVFRHLVHVRSWWMRVVFPRLVDRFFVVSDFARETLIDAGAPREHLRRLYNPIDFSRFRPDAATRTRVRETLALAPDVLLVGFVGRHESSKGIRVLRDALHRSMDQEARIHALWVGDGCDLLETRATVDAGRHRRQHHFIEWTSTPEQIYAALDCLVMPSLAPETFGRVVAEAQACGVPVIASAQWGLAEAFAPGHTGEAFAPSHDGAALGAQIVDLCRNQARRRKMSVAGQQFVRRFDARLVVHSFVEYLKTAEHADSNDRSARSAKPGRSRTKHGKYAGAKIARLSETNHRSA